MASIRPTRRFASLLAAAIVCAVASASFAQEPGRDRERVDIHQAPFQAIGQVNTAAYGRCTGTLIARQIALTAAHCLFNRRTGRLLQPGSVHFVLGYDRGSYDFATRARAIHRGSTAPASTDRESLNGDWALIELAEPAPNSIEPMAVAPSAPQAGERLSAAGFGRDRAYALSAVGDCLYRSGAEDGLMIVNCPIIEGYSGGPLIDQAGRLSGLIVASGRNASTGLAVALPPAAWEPTLRGLQKP